MGLNKTVLIFLFFSVSLNAQIIERQVFATGGDYFEANNIQLSHTIGEPIPEYFLQATIHLTQGFQQGELDALTLANSLLHFHAKRHTEQEVFITWTISSNEVGKSFVLERMLEENSSFERVYKTDQTEDNTYDFLDLNHHNKESYYRLKTISNNNEIEYSEVRTVNGVPLKNLVAIFPNPINEELTFTINSDHRFSIDNIHIQVFDYQGKQWAQESQPYTNSRIRSHIFENLPTGNFIIQIRLDNLYTQQIHVSKI